MWEHNIVPRERARSYLAEVVHTAMLLAMLLMLWHGAGVEGYDRYFYDVIGQLVGCFMPAALAMLLAMRCGVLDVSVWMSWSAGSVLAAAILRAALPGEGEVHAGGWPWLAFAAAAGCGAAIGGVNALLSRIPRLPAVVATAVTALLVWGLLHAVTTEREIPVHPRTFDAWHLETDVPVETEDDGNESADVMTACAPLAVTRMLAVALMLSAVLLAMLLRVGRSANASLDPTPPPWVRAVALVAGGTVAALGGALWLLEHNTAAVPRLPVHDLRIPVAVVLAGGLVLAGKGRSLLTVLYLPLAMLVTTLWYLDGWDLNARGYAFHLLVMLAAAVTVSLSLRAFALWGTATLKLAAACAVASTLLLVVPTLTNSVSLATYAHTAAVALLIGGVALLAVGVRRQAVGRGL